MKAIMSDLSVNRALPFLFSFAFACDGEQKITVYTQPPTVTVQTPINGSEVDQGVPILLRGLVSDEKFESDLTVVIPQWTANGVPICAETTIDALGFIECTHVFNDPGGVSLLLLATNPDGESAQAESIIMVNENAAPTAEIISPQPNDFGYRDVLTLLSGQVSDEEDDPEELSISWNSSLDGDLELSDQSPDSNGLSTRYSMLSQGEHVLTFRVTDTTGRFSEASVVYNVGGDNVVPECEIVSPINGETVLNNSQQSFLGTAFDPDVPLESLIVEWTSTIDGFLGQQTPDPSGNFSLPVTNLTSGSHTISLKVSDETGASCSQSVDLVVGNPPAVSITSPMNGLTFNEEEMLIFEAVVSDVEDASSDISLNWSSDLEGLFCVGCNANSNGTATALAFSWTYGIHTVTVTATDSDGFSTQDSIIIYINDLPSSPQVDISPNPATSSDDLSVAILSPSVDLESDPITYTYNWIKSGIVSTIVDPTLPYTETTRGEQWELHVIPNDGFGDGVVGVASVIVGNSPPEVTSLTVTPALPVEGDVMSCSVAASYDEDGDPISYSYDWLINGSAIGVIGPTLDSSHFEYVDAIQCAVLPNDGIEDGATFVSAVIAVQNTAPSIGSVDLQPIPAYESSVLTCSPLNVTDADGDTVSFEYEWLVNGQSINTPSSTLDGSYFDKGDTVECVLTPTDGTSYGTPVTSNSVTISNSQPVLDQSFLSPDPAYEDSILNCAAGNSSDIDGDTVTVHFDWRRNGNLLGVNAVSLEGTHFDKGDTVTCVITPNDGFDNGAAVDSPPIVISNTPPSLDSASLSPLNPTELDNVLCEAGTSSDIDGDSVSYLYAWSVDGQVISATTQTLTGADFNRGQQISCTITPTDGQDLGLPVTTDILTIENSAPIIADLSLTPNIATEDSVLTCTESNVSDADGDSVSVDYNWSINGQMINTNSSTIHGAVFNRNDFVICFATPTDGYDQGLQVASNPVSIQNSPPVLDTATLSPSTIVESSTVYCVPGNFSDADGDSVLPQYSWVLNGATLGTSLNAISGQFFNKGDSLQCGISPFDGTDFGGLVLSAPVIIDNTPPSISSVSISPSSATINDTLVCNMYGVADEDGDSVSANYQWFVDGVMISHTGSTLTSAFFNSGQTIQCRVTPHDGEDSGSSVDSQVLSIGNTPPELDSASLSPSTAYETTTLQCTPGAASDADGSPVSFHYKWNIAGSMNNLNQSTLDGAYFNKGDQVFCIVTPNDGIGDGLPVSSNTITIQNTAPTLSSASVSPNPATESSVLNCGPGASSDVDGDVVSFLYNWKKNGSSLGHSGQQISGVQFNRGDMMTCVVTPTDGQDSGVSVESNGVVISNTAPTVSSVSIDPPQAFTDTVLSADIQGWSDIDGDSPGYLYQWTVNGSSVSTNATLDPNLMAKGDQVDVTVTPTDGFDQGFAISSGVIVIENTAPEAPVLQIQPTDAEPGDDLNCAIIQGSNDIDGDSIAYQYSWSKDGVPQSSLNNVNPISGSLTGQNQTWTCTVTPNDGDTNGPAAYDSQVVLDVTAPSTPVLDPLDPYRNDSTVFITGSSEGGATIVLDIDCDSGFTTNTTIADANGTFGFTVSMIQGDSCSFSAVASDANGNVSSSSNTVSTEVCSLSDNYEDSSGYGDTCGAAIDEWGTLSDSALNTVYITGNILNSGDSDWYSFTASQSVLSSGVNTYNAGISLVSGGSYYAFRVYRGSCGSSAQECAASGGLSEYNFFAEDKNEGTNHSVPSDNRYCQNGSGYNNCNDLSATYYVEVYRTSNAYDCNGYELEFSNGY